MIRIATIVLCFVLQTAFLLCLNWQTSPNRTEEGHLGSAVYLWNSGRFDVFCVNPPLTRALVGLPIILNHWNEDLSEYGVKPLSRSEWGLGGKFIHDHDAKTIRWDFFLARSILIPLILFGAWFGWKFSSELYGQTAGTIFLILWTFSPLFLGWGATICPDMAGASLGVVGLYAFWRWLKTPNWRWTLLAGLCLGLMLLTKMTWLIAFPLYLLLWVIWLIAGRKREQADKNVPVRSQLVRLAIVFVFAIYLVNLGYCFQGSFKPLKDYQFTSETLTGYHVDEYTEEVRVGNRFADSILGYVPVPFPTDFVQGIDIQRRDFEVGIESFLNGDFSRHGWKSYYCFVLLYKEPLGFLLLFALAIGLSLFNPRHFWNRDELIPLLTFIFLFVFISSQDGFSLHPRYILPAMPFMYIFVSKVGLAFTNKKYILAGLTTVLLLWGVASSLWQFPHSMSYFNEIVGTDIRTKYLQGSNVDWGQNAYFFKSWCDQNRDKHIFTTVLSDQDLKHYNIPNAKNIKMKTCDTFAPGFYAIGANDLYDRTDKYESFRLQKPIDKIGYSIYIYEIE